MKDIDGYHVLRKGAIVDVMSTARCNLRCKHCYLPYKGEIEASELLDLVNNLRGDYDVRINGAEPLLNRGYLAAFEANDYDTVLTNGLVFWNNFDYIDELVKRGIKIFRISYHFDMCEQFESVEKEYLLELFKEIAKRGGQVKIGATITAKNYKKVPEYCEFCVKNGIKMIKFTNYIRQGRAKGLDDDLVLNDAQLQEFFDIIGEERRKYDKEVLLVERCGSFGPNWKNPERFQCGAGIDGLALTPDYKVFPCIFLTEPEYQIGFYRDGKIFVRDDYKPCMDRCLAKDIFNN